MIGRHDAGPDRSGDAHVAEAHGHGPAAAAVAVRLNAVDLTDTGGQAEHHFAVGRGCGRRGRIGHRGDIHGHAMTLRHGFHDLPGGGEHVVVADARQNAAVDVEHVLARQGIDIGDVLFVARRDERAARGLEQRIDLSIDGFQIPHVQNHIGGGDQRVAAFLRAGRVALMPKHLDAHPQLAFLGNFDGGTIRHAVIGHDHEIIGAKQIGVGLEDVVDAVTAGSLFVGNENQAKGEVGGDALRLQFLCNEQAANDGLLIVLHATATDLVAVDDNLPRIGLPVGKLSRRHNVHMPQNPEPTRRRAGDARDHIGAHAVGDPRVGRVNAQDVRYAELTQQPFQIQGFGHFARAAVLRAESGEFRHAGLVFDDLVPLLSDGLNKPRKTCHMFLVYGFGK